MQRNLIATIMARICFTPAVETINTNSLFFPLLCRFQVLRDINIHPRHSKSQPSRSIYGPSFSDRDLLVLHLQSSLLFIPSQCCVTQLPKTNATVEYRRKTETGGALALQSRPADEYTYLLVRDTLRLHRLSSTAVGSALKGVE